MKSAKTIVKNQIVFSELVVGSDEQDMNNEALSFTFCASSVTVNNN